MARDYRTPGGRLIGLGCAGLAAAMAVVVKLTFAPIFVVFVLVSTWEHSPSRDFGTVFRTLLNEVAPFAIGVFAVLTVVSAIFAVNGAFKELVWTAFVYPWEAYETKLATPMRLVSALTWFGLAMLPWIIFSGIAVPRIFRRGEPLLFKLMAAWIVIGFAVILVQRFSWWQYHFLFLFVPTAVLGVRGLDILLHRLQQTQHVGAGFRTAISFALVLVAFGNTVQQSARTWEALLQSFGGEGGGTEAYRRAVGKEYERLRREVADVRDDRTPGDIYVFGNPLYYLFFERSQAIATQSWGWQNAVAEQWRNLAPALTAAQPAFIYMSGAYRPLVERNSPQTIALLGASYRVVREDELGTWYRRSSSG